MNFAAADEALNAYNKARGESDTLECDLIDLIADLLYLAERRDEDPLVILRLAQLHFEMGD